MIGGYVTVVRMQLWRFIDLFLRIYEILILARVVMSWVQMESNKLSDFVYRVTEPVLRPIRELIPAVAGVIDFSPLIAFMLLTLVRRLLFALLVW